MSQGNYRIVFGRYGTLQSDGYQQVYGPPAFMLMQLGEEILVELPTSRAQSVNLDSPSLLADMYGRWARAWVIELHRNLWNDDRAHLSRAIEASKQVEDWRHFGAAVLSTLSLGGLEGLDQFLLEYEK